MLLRVVGARCFTGRQTVVNVSPVIGRNIRRIDVPRLDRVDELKYAFDLRPSIGAQQDVATGAHEWQGLAALAGTNGAYNVEPRKRSAVVVGGPANKGENTVRCERHDASAAVEDLFGDLAAEPDPEFDLLLDPRQLDMGQCIGRWRWRQARRFAAC